MGIKLETYHYIFWLDFIVHRSIPIHVPKTNGRVAKCNQCKIRSGNLYIAFFGWDISAEHRLQCCFHIDSV